MKKIIIAFCIVLLATASYAQKDSSKFIISINAGIASPSGNFAKGDYADEKSGFTKTGEHYNINVVKYFKGGFGIGVLGGYSQYQYNGSQSLSDGYKEDSGTDSTTLYHKSHTRSFSFLIGPYYSIAVGDKAALNLRAMGGYVQSHLAGFQVFFEDYLDNPVTQKEASAGAFGYQLGAGISYNVTQKIALQINADFFNSKPKFDISYENFVVNSGRRLTTYNEDFQGVNATIGIAFNLCK